MYHSCYVKLIKGPYRRDLSDIEEDLTEQCFFVAKPKLPGDFADKTWSKLQAAVRAVHEKQPVSCSLEDLYRVGGAVTLCTLSLCSDALKVAGGLLSS